MKKLINIIIVMLLAFSLFAQALVETPSVPETVSFTDYCGRTVEIPKNITKVAPSGNVATMLLSALAPDYMCNVNAVPSSSQMQYLPANLASLPPTGQLYGGKATLNTEELIALGADILIDIGDYKKGIEADLDAVQEQIGIPCIFLSGTLEDMADTFRLLGSLLDGKKDKAEEIASFIDTTIEMASANRAKIQDSEVVSLMFSSASQGLGTNAKGSSQAQVLDIVGVKNAIELETINNKSGGNLINMEQLYNFDPDVIVFAETGVYETVGSDVTWQNLQAIKNNKYYLVPEQPYNWLSNPPSLNMVLGIWWLGNLVYPQYYDYDMAQVAKDFYKLFWDYDLTDAEVLQMLENSIVKSKNQ